MCVLNACLPVCDRHSATEDVVLMHVAAQAPTGLEQERPLVLAAVQVRDMHAAPTSYDARLPDLVSVRIDEEDARREHV